MKDKKFQLLERLEILLKITIKRTLNLFNNQIRFNKL